MMRGCVTQPRKTDKIQPTVIYDLDINTLVLVLFIIASVEL